MGLTDRGMRNQPLAHSVISPRPVDRGTTSAISHDYQRPTTRLHYGPCPNPRRLETLLDWKTWSGTTIAQMYRISHIPGPTAYGQGSVYLSGPVIPPWHRDSSSHVGRTLPDTGFWQPKDAKFMTELQIHRSLHVRRRCIICRR